MSARSVRRTFATPFVVTLTAGGCFVDRPPPPVYRDPPREEHVISTDPSYPPGVSPSGDPYAPAPTTTQPPVYVQPGQPSPYVQPPAPVATYTNPPPVGAPAPTPVGVVSIDRRWTISRSINQCLANLQYSCPPTRPGGPPCAPPSPTLYTCPPDLPDSQTMIIYQRANEPDCYVLPAPVSCPPNVMCNPPPARKAICPQ